MNQTISMLSPALPEIVLLGMVCMTLLADLCLPKGRQEIAYLLSILSLLLTSALVCLKFQAMDPVFTFSHMFVSDRLGNLLKLVMLVCVFFTLVYSRQYVAQKKFAAGEFYSLALLSDRRASCRERVYVLV